VTAYASASDVGAYCQNVLGGASNFSASSSPNVTAVSNWLNAGGAVLEAHMSGWGYDVPVGATTVVYNWLTDLNTLYAAARVEMSRSNVVLSPGERTRGQVFDEMFRDGLKRLKGMDLSLAGATRSYGTLYVGGISDADKSTVVSDTDRTTPRVTRSMFNLPGTLQPGEGRSSDE